MHGNQIVVTLPTAHVAQARAATSDIMAPIKSVQTSPETTTAIFDVDATTARNLGGPAFYVPGVGPGSQEGMWSYVRPGV